MIVKNFPKGKFLHEYVRTYSVQKKTRTCSSGDRAMVSGTMWRGFESLQVRFFTQDAAAANGGKDIG